MGKDNEFLNSDLEDVENDNDDLEVNNDDGDTEDVDVDLEKLIKSMAKDDDGKEDDDDPEDDPEPEEKPAEGEDEPEITPELEKVIEDRVNERVVTEVNRIIQSRLARDRKTQDVAKFEQLTGMSLEQATEMVTQNIIAAKADELGISEEEARAIVAKDQELAGLKAERTVEQQQKADIDAAMQQVKYLQDKQAYMSKPKLARVLKDCMAEIDAFTQNGTLLPFEDGVKYVLGNKLVSGELLNKVQEGAEKKAIANQQRQPKAAPQAKGNGSKSDTVVLSKEERQIAANLGLSEKEYAEEKLKELNRKQRKGR